MATKIEELKISFNETSKQKTMEICCNFEYHFKYKSKDEPPHLRWVCKVGCGASITTRLEIVQKINGIAAEHPTTEMIANGHRDHGPLTDKKILANQFVSTMKKRARNGEIVGQLHQAAEQDFLVAVVGMDDDENSADNFVEAAVAFPQFSSIQSSLGLEYRLL